MDSKELAKYSQVLHNAFDNDAFVQSTIAQIEKDFATFNQELRLKVESGNLYDQLVQSVSVVLTILIQVHPEQLPALLYRIDVPEVVTNQVLSHEDYVLRLAEVIVQREALKVYFRQTL